jgi:internalin A
MQEYWQAHARWNADPASAFEEAERRIAACAESKGDRLYLGDIKLDRLPPAISALTWLRDLDLYGSPVDNFTWLAPLTNVRSLKIGSLHAAFPGLAFLRGWAELRDLQLISPTPVDLAPLASCVDLTRLSISCGKHKVELHNFDRLAVLKFLDHLALSNLQSDQFEAIGTWRALTFVQLVNSNLNSLRAFENLQDLEYLSIRGAPVSDLSPLSTLAKLRRLDVGETTVHDLTPLSSISTLEELSIAHTPIDDLQPLAKLARGQSTAGNCESTRATSSRGLRSFDLSGCPVDDLTPLSGFEGLERIDLSNTSVTSLTPLHRRRSLDSLTLSGAPIHDLGPRGALSGLGFLTARNTPIRDISALEPAHRLQGIDIAQTPVSNLRPLQDARNCRTILLRGSLVDDLTPILKTGSQEEDHRYTAQKLDFRDTPAARTDARLADLAALADTDPHRCFVETKHYLKAQADACGLRRR